MRKPIILAIFLLIQCTPDGINSGDTVNENTLTEIKILVLAKTNKIRQDQNLSPLVQSDAMDTLAKYHSDNMVKFNFFSHTDQDGLSPFQRADKFGYTFSAMGENIVQIPWGINVLDCGNTKSAEAMAECMVEWWRNSPGHYANMTGDYVELGVGISVNDKNEVHGTQVFRTQ